MTDASDSMLREGVREGMTSWLKKLSCGGDVEKQWQYKKNFIERLRHSPIAIETEKSKEQHYEVPTEFFLTVLGDRLKYSCCIWEPRTATIEQAEDASLELICKRAKIEDGHAVMDLGCGWGALSLYICENFPKCRVTAVSNSRTQRELIESRAVELGFSGRLQCITTDANVFTTPDKFDRILSIEMFEILCHKEFAYSFDVKKGSDTEWMARNFFSGGTMPSADLFAYFQNDVILTDIFPINGSHYAKTLDAWLERLDQNKTQVVEILEKHYGKTDAVEQLFNWRLFFLFCSEVFGYKNGNEWMVAQHLFRKRLTSQL